MKKNKIAVGLDIGTTKIVAMIGRENEQGKLEVLGIGRAKSLGVKRGVVNNITQTIMSIQQAIEEAQSVSGQSVENVVVGIAGQHIRSLHHSDYITRQKSDIVINEQDIESLVGQVHKLGMQPGEEIIHVLPQEYKVDSQSDIKEPIGMYGGRLEANFHVVVGQVSSIRNITRCVNSAGLNLASITLEPLASALAVLSQEEKEAGVALIDIGGGTTDLAIFKDGVIRHTAVIPFGGNIITEDIKEGCSIIEKQAELLKVKFGSAWPGENTETEIVSIPGLRGREPKEISLKNLSKIIHARVQEIVNHVYLEIKKYGHETQKGKLIAGIVLTGGGAQLKHLRQLVEYITGMDVRIGYPNEHLSGDSSDALASPEYATAVGLLMEGLYKDVKTIPVAPKVVAKESEEKIILEAQADSDIQKEAFLKEQERKKEHVSKANPSKSKSFFDKFADRFKEFLDNVE
ncbi:cell division protein FtsA [Tenacibaculum piscium]|uniref:Cell division protein FtsA n=2 Tax=Tenacibaculum piscium TaxID=1458515 RepID=A0A2H1YIX9_9FLAO|nr:cell division protein FtsA [Tenacibaculum piscium]MBE7628677.1 cell division protein FtsA [Tenacibaculum piscium]MBE7669818.1 cell division protein FtsA [Tenacibaculum piscium]MBE7684587.1 cell division protein FtsA [Tenacibaculum piscium]MBE7689207.1 cell division protein FtsA [Tenacibaculum piscium]SOS75466.1 Cell division protein FtsA [Tenacibaculum piscium]